MAGRRTIESAIGHRIAIDILPDDSGIRLSRDDATVPDAIDLDERGARILSAFLSSALVVERDQRAPEAIGDVMITMLHLPAPMVRIEQRGNMVDIHAPLWEAVHCEIDLVIPRLRTRSTRQEM